MEKQYLVSPVSYTFPHLHSPRSPAELGRRQHLPFITVDVGLLSRAQSPRRRLLKLYLVSAPWQLPAPHLQASSHTLPDLKPCPCHPWPGLNAWHSPSMFSETASTSCLAVARSNPAWRTTLAFRGTDKEGPIGVVTQAPGSPSPSLVRTCSCQAQFTMMITSCVCSDELLLSKIRAHFDEAEAQSKRPRKGD